MAKTIGVTLSEHVRAGLIVDYKLAAPLHCFPEDLEEDGALIELPTTTVVVYPGQTLAVDEHRNMRLTVEPSGPGRR